MWERLIGSVIYCTVSVLRSSFFPLPPGLFLIRLSLHIFISGSLQMHTCGLQAKVSLEVIVSMSRLPVFQRVVTAELTLFPRNATCFRHQVNLFPRKTIFHLVEVDVSEGIVIKCRCFKHGKILHLRSKPEFKLVYVLGAPQESPHRHKAEYRMRGWPNLTGQIKRSGWHTCMSVHMRGKQAWGTGGLRWGEEVLCWMRGRVIYHLQKGVHRGLEFKAGEKEGGGCGGKSPSFSLSSVPTVSFMATDHSADARFSLALAVLSHKLLPSRGPRKLLFRSLVQQIHTDARGRRRQRDKGFLSTCFPQ